MIPLPNQIQRFVAPSGTILPPWTQYLQQFTQAPPNFLELFPDISPFSYKAVEPGMIAIEGGAVFGTTLTRGIISINVFGQILIPVSIADTVEISFTDTPTVFFIPSYGQRTG